MYQMIDLTALSLEVDVVIEELGVFESTVGAINIQQAVNNV